MSQSNPDEPSRQKRVGEMLRQDTRDRLLHAAATEFATGGYAATTVSRLASAAGVSVQTLYLAWGSKRALLRGYMEDVLAGGADTPEAASDGFTGLPPQQRLTELARLVAEIAQRAATAWSLYRDAAAVDPEIAADWNELQLLRRRLFARVIAAIPAEALRQGLTTESAIDTAWAIASPETYDLLVRRLGYDSATFEAWMRSTLIAAVLGARYRLDPADSSGTF